MKRASFLTSLGLVLATIGLEFGHRSLAGEKEIVLQDHIKLEWSNELVTQSRTSR